MNVSRRPLRKWIPIELGPELDRSPQLILPSRVSSGYPRTQRNAKDMHCWNAKDMHCWHKGHPRQCQPFAGALVFCTCVTHIGQVPSDHSASIGAADLPIAGQNSRTPIARRNRAGTRLNRPSFLQSGATGFEAAMHVLSTPKPRHTQSRAGRRSSAIIVPCRVTRGPGARLPGPARMARPNGYRHSNPGCLEPLVSQGC